MKGERRRAAPPGPAVRCVGLVHVYQVSGTDVAALRGVDLVVAPGQRVALLGPSGSGKSTLMSIVSGMMAPSAGTVEVLGTPIQRADSRTLLRLRRDGLGLMLQGAATNLLLHADAMTNVDWTIAGTGHGDEAVARRVLDAYGLTDDRRPVGAMPAAEQQVVAFAVAMSAVPRLLLADEPTSQLDDDGRDRLLALLTEVTEEAGTAVLMVTHDEAAAAHLQRMIHLRDGRIAEEATDAGRYAVVASDGSVQLPARLLERWPAGALVEIGEDGPRLVLTRADEP